MKPHPLADVIACSTLDARDPVKLPPPSSMPLDFVEAEIVPVIPMCSACKVKHAGPSWAHMTRGHELCGDPKCKLIARNRAHREISGRGRW